MKAIRLAARPDIVRRSLAVSAVVGGDGDLAWPTAAGPPPYPQKQTSSEAHPYPLSAKSGHSSPRRIQVSGVAFVMQAVTARIRADPLVAMARLGRLCADAPKASALCRRYDRRNCGKRNESLQRISRSRYALLELIRMTARSRGRPC